MYRTRRDRMYRITDACYRNVKHPSKWQNAWVAGRMSETQDYVRCKIVAPSYAVQRIRETQDAIIEALPDDRNDKEKARLALLAAQESYRSMWSTAQDGLLSTFKKDYIKSIKSHLKFVKAAETFSVCLDDKEGSRLMRVGAEKAGITVEQIRLAISEALDHKRERIHPPKEESKNPITRKGLHDIAVGRVLVNNGINRKEAARVIAKLRKKLPRLGVNYDSQKSVLVEDIDKETRSIEQRLRDHGI
jgi:hypothetical protein